MKFNFSLISAFILLTSAAPAPNAEPAFITPTIPTDVSDTATDMVRIITGQEGAKCSPVAAIFARGTFDSGNIGVWVGPHFFAALKAGIPNIALQGLDKYVYSATLDDYLQGGNMTAANGINMMIKEYVKKCPGAVIIVSGWSQGALTLNIALDELAKDKSEDAVAALKQIKAAVFFGNPNRLFKNLPVPKSIGSVESPCVQGPIPDGLCAGFGDIKFSSLREPFKKIHEVASGDQQKEAARYVLAELTNKLLGDFPMPPKFLKSMKISEYRRLALFPQHFTYGNHGEAKKEAQAIAALDSIKNAKLDNTKSANVKL